MMWTKALPLGAICLAAATFAAQAQSPYPAAPPAPAAALTPAIPPAWYYNPYTSGLAACVQWSPNDPENCRDQRKPSLNMPASRPSPG